MKSSGLAFPMRLKQGVAGRRRATWLSGRGSCSSFVRRYRPNPWKCRILPIQDTLRSDEFSKNISLHQKYTK